MERKDFDFNGKLYNGFLALFINLVLIPAWIATPFLLSMQFAPSSDLALVFSGINAGVFGIWFLIMLCGFFTQEPGETRVMIFFGKYRGTFSDTGFFWANPFLSKKKLTLRARNLDGEPIKVNDKVGNPIMIGLVLVWKLKDTYKAMFEIDAQTLAQRSADGTTNVVGRMKAFEDFVRVQSDAALRQVAGQYAYDQTSNAPKELTLRSGGDEINEQLEQQLNERLSMAGIEVVEARINYLAYAPEIAAVMLRRQQADAIITAREKIVEGAVSMVKMAIDRIEEEQLVFMDEKTKAAMISNLLVVLCSEDSAQPVVNSGTQA